MDSREKEKEEKGEKEKEKGEEEDKVEEREGIVVSSVTTFDSRASVKKLKEGGTVSRFRQNFQN